METMMHQRQWLRSPIMAGVVTLALGSLLVAGLFKDRLHEAGQHEAAPAPSPVVFGPDLSNAGVLAEATPQRSSAVSGRARGFCAGDELLCSTSTTTKPAELLARLTAALPRNSAKQYRVRVSVEIAEQ